MHVALKLAARNEDRFDPQTSSELAWMLLEALAELLCMRQLNSRELHPAFFRTEFILAGKLEHMELFDPVEALMGRLRRACALLAAAESLLTTTLSDRVVLPNARLPVPVIHVPKLSDLLVYDEKKDQIQCQAGDASELVAKHYKILKALAGIGSAGLIPTIELDGPSIPIPDVSPTFFSHGTGTGRSVVSTCCVSGLLLVAGEIEVRVEGLRDGRVIRAQLSDAARLAAIDFHPPYTAAIEYSEAVPYLPLLPIRNGRVVVERLWDFQQQAELPFA